jgi:hypothetical protein
MVSRLAAIQSILSKRRRGHRRSSARSAQFRSRESSTTTAGRAIVELHDSITGADTARAATDITRRPSVDAIYR